MFKPSVGLFIKLIFFFANSGQVDVRSFLFTRFYFIVLLFPE